MTHTEPTPRSLDEYLAQLRSALAGADSAMIQDALSDAESHLRAEFAARAGESEESVLRSIVGSYGSPADVASAYRETERTVQAANAPAAPARSATSAAADTGALRRFFGIYGDVHAWTALFYMGLSLLTGIFYFVFVVTGLALSLGLSILIIGLPFFVAFIGMARVLSLAEGRLVEAVTGERMPRRARPTVPGGLLARIGSMLRDLRTWTTLAYQFLMLPIGTLYFSVAITLSAIGVALVGVGVSSWLELIGLHLPTHIMVDGEEILPAWLSPWTGLASIAVGVLTLTVLLHLARLVGRLHGKLAKQLLVAG